MATLRRVKTALERVLMPVLSFAECLFLTGLAPRDPHLLTRNNCVQVAHV